MVNTNPNSNFKITCMLNKAYEYHDLTSRQTKKRIQGMASGLAVDRDGERMSRSVIDSFKKTIQQGIFLDSGEWSFVPLVSEHRKNGLGEPQWDQILGHLVDAWVDPEWNLWIEAELDPDNPASDLLYKKLTKDPEEGKPFNGGLSIGGRVIDAGMEWDDEIQRSIHTYRDVSLNEVTVTSAPSFPTKYLAALQKSVDWEKMESNEENTPMKLELTKEDAMKLNKNVATEEEVAEEAVDKSEDVSAEVAVESDDINKEVEVAADQDAASEEEQDVDKEQAEDVEASEAVEKSEEQVEEEVVEAPAYVTTDAFETLASTVNVLAGQLATFAETFEKSVSRGIITDPRGGEAEEPVVENETPEEDLVVEEVGSKEVPEEVVEEQEVEEVEETETAPDVLERSIAALLEGMTQMNAKINDLDKSFNAKIEAFGNLEVDKSVIPSRANDNLGQKDNTMNEFEEALKGVTGADAFDLVFKM